MLKKIYNYEMVFSRLQKSVIERNKLLMRDRDQYRSSNVFIAFEKYICITNERNKRSEIYILGCFKQA